MKLSRAVAWMGLHLLMVVGAQAMAQAWPSKPLRMIISFPPGGAADLVGRALGEYLGQTLGQSIVIENRGGAAGIPASEMAARSAPDGYTLFLANDGNLVINRILYDKLPYDIKDFAPVSLIAMVPMVLVANAESIRSLKDLVAAAKAKPGALSYASAGTGSPHHLAMELLKTAAGINLVHVPYKGGAPALQDVLGGRVPVMFGGTSTSLPHIKAGKLIALGVGSAQRSPLMRDVPTVAELGFPGFEFTSWAGIVVPRGTPADIIARLQQGIAHVKTVPAFRERMFAGGNEPVSSTPDEFAALIERDYRNNLKLVRDAGIKRED